MHAKKSVNKSDAGLLTAIFWGVVFILAAPHYVAITRLITDILQTWFAAHPIVPPIPHR